VVKSNFAGRNDHVAAQVMKAVEAMKAAGAVIVEVPEVPNADKLGKGELTVLYFEIKAGMSAYLAEYAPGFAMQSLATWSRSTRRTRRR
jgi:amidase